MLPLSMRLRVTSRDFDDWAAPDAGKRVDWWAGFRLDGPSGRLGTVHAVGLDPATGEPAWLLVRTGLFMRRSETIPIEDVEWVDLIRRRVTVATRGR